MQPVALDYGALAREIAWTGDEGSGANAMRVLSRRGSIPLTISFLAPIDPHEAGDRKTLAAWAQAEVGAVLAASEAGSDPLYGRR
ncbi:hypothetical protein [Sphingosinicella sp.]|uniref:hypothetical protein n=1 Tax=Sphingosinicella sp. TaxID=1917971 RepID=UPI0040384B80